MQNSFRKHERECAAAVEIAGAYPHLTGRGFDLPQMRPLAKAHAALPKGGVLVVYDRRSSGHL